ncbi:MAG: hypothetical protein QOE90_1785 [Thermoplasmata archaeon]|nr:hypothetical protein [Thermoplasmata archaeon]
MADLSSYLRTDYKAVDKREGLHAVMGWLKGDADKLPIVMDDGKPFGIVNERALSSRRLDDKAKIENYALVTRALPQTASLDEVARRMSELRAAFLPIEDKRGKLAGYVSAIDVARERGAATRNARELAVPVTALRAEQTLGEALHAFTHEYVDHLPVLDAAGRLQGVVHRRDVLVLEANNADKGRMDAVSEKQRPLKDALGGFADDASGVVPAGAGFDAVAAAIESWGYALVQDGAGRIAGIVTAETLLRSLIP